MHLPRKLPARMPPPSVLRHIAFPPAAAALMPRVSPLGVRAAPRIPRLMQARVRSARRLAGLELPSSSPPLSTSHADQALPSDSALPTNATPRLASGSARDIERVERQLKIEENMARMDERIRAWKEEKAKAKLLKKKGDMPF